MARMSVGLHRCIDQDRLAQGAWWAPLWPEPPWFFKPLIKTFPATLAWSKQITGPPRTGGGRGWGGMEEARERNPGILGNNSFHSSFKAQFT